MFPLFLGCFSSIPFYTCTNDFGLIGPPTAELAVLEHLKKNPHTLIMGKRGLLFFSAVLDRILFMLAGNDNIHESLVELKFGQIRPLVSMVTDRVMMGKRCSTLYRLFFIRAFPYLQVTMTCMRAQTSSNFGLIGPLTAELAARERLKKSP